jgi:SAM-dependent methyltransferase
MRTENDRAASPVPPAALVATSAPAATPAAATMTPATRNDRLIGTKQSCPLGVSPVNDPASRLLAVAESFDPVAHNRAAWDREVDNDNEWTRPVSSDVIARARAGDWSVVLIGHQPVPRDWFPADLAGAAVLCLASGGGQQGPVLAAAGAAVTVFDNSPRQLARDQEVAAREGLAIRTVLGDMRDLGALPDASFEMVFNPVSNVFCPDLAPVWREAFRVLRPGGLLLAGFMNPDLFVFDDVAAERGELVARHPLPFSSLDLPDAERERFYGDGPVVFSHSLTGQIGGQLSAGFILTHLAEARFHEGITARYLPGYLATRAVKPG